MLIGYARVSTQEQNLDSQLSALKKVGCEKTYFDKISGINPFKPQLEELLKFARAGDTFVVWRLDRLGRNLKDLIEFSTKLKALGLGFVSLTEKIDTTTPAGELYFNLMGSFAQFERDVITERTRAGIAAAKAKGKHLGRKPSLTTAQWKLAKQQLNEGALVPDVASLFSVSPDTIYRYKRKDKQTSM